MRRPGIRPIICQYCGRKFRGMLPDDAEEVTCFLCIALGRYGEDKWKEQE